MSNEHTNDSRTQWIADEIYKLPMQARELMSICLQATAMHSKDSLQSTLETDISRDLWRMQQQPRIMDDYRRFVVIKGIGNRSTPADEYEVFIDLSQFPAIKLTTTASIARVVPFERFQLWRRLQHGELGPSHITVLYRTVSLRHLNVLGTRDFGSKVALAMRKMRVTTVVELWHAACLPFMGFPVGAVPLVVRLSESSISARALRCVVYLFWHLVGTPSSMA